MNVASRTVPLALVLSLAACVSAPTAPVATVPPVTLPAPAPTPVPPPVRIVVVPASDLPANWNDQPRTEGDWAYRQDSQGSAALFSGAQGQPLMSVSCRAGSGQVTLIRFARPVPGTVRVDIRTETAQRTADAMVLADGSAATWSLPTTDNLLDAMAFSRGHFALGVTGTVPLYPPSFPEITRVIEDCRR